MPLVDSIGSFLDSAFQPDALDASMPADNPFDGSGPLRSFENPSPSFFGRNAALQQAQAFDGFSDSAWNAVDSLRADRSLPGPVRDLVSLSQPFMAVGLGALGLANDVATVVRDPSLLAEPFLQPAAAAASVKNGIVDFFSDPNPFHQTQHLVTNVADPALAGVHVAGELGQLGRASLNTARAFAADVGDSMTRLYDKGALEPSNLGFGLGAMFPPMRFHAQSDLIEYWAQRMPSIEGAPTRLGEPDRDFSAYMRPDFSKSTRIGLLDVEAQELVPVARPRLEIDYRFPSFIGVEDFDHVAGSGDDHFITGSFMTSPVTKATPHTGLYLDDFEVRQSNHPLALAFGSRSEMFGSLLKKAEIEGGRPVNHFFANIFEADADQAAFGATKGTEWRWTDGKRFHQLMREGMDPRSALDETWIGRQARSLGFTEVAIDPALNWNTSFIPMPGHGHEFLFNRPGTDHRHLVPWLW